MVTKGAWGGGIELVAFSHSRRVNLHVYRVILSSLSCYGASSDSYCSYTQVCPNGNGFQLIRSFNQEGCERTINLVSWLIGSHYDFLLLRPGNTEI